MPIQRVQVTAAYVANAARSGILTPDRKLVSLIEERFGDVLRDEIGLEPAALTADEASYLAGFKDADAFRGSLAKAASERERRLSSKGIQERSPGLGYEQSYGDGPRGRIVFQQERAIITLYRERNSRRPDWQIPFARWRRNPLAQPRPLPANAALGGQTAGKGWRNSPTTTGMQMRE